MEHTRETTSVLVEPDNGTKLIVWDGEEWTVIWRDDKAADEWYHGDAPEGEHWFRATDEDPMELHQYLKYAEVVYQLGPVLVNFEAARSQ